MDVEAVINGLDSFVQLVAFSLEGQGYALPLASVERVLPAVALTPLPEAPAIVLGLLNLGGRVVPVVNIRRRFRLPERGVELADRLIVARTARRTLALLVDTVSGVIEVAPEIVTMVEDVLPGLTHVRGVVRVSTGLILVHDLETCLSLDEAVALDEALSPAGEGS